MQYFKDIAKKENVYRIVNDWTHEYVETLNASDAIDKYGECLYYGGYTEGFTENGGFEVTVWLDCWS